ncbi:MAG: hypothetical protein R3E97_08650 [Candidatus Eisenbacteria bacterium]
MSAGRASRTVADWARLARIEIPEEERAGLEDDFDRIVRWMSALGEFGADAARNTGATRDVRAARPSRPARREDAAASRSSTATRHS